MEKCRIPDKRYLFCLWIRTGEPSCKAYSGSHAETGIYHVKGIGISKGITPNIPGENRISLNLFFKLFCSLFESVKNSSMHATGTEGRGPGRKGRKFIS